MRLVIAAAFALLVSATARPIVGQTIGVKIGPTFSKMETSFDSNNAPETLTSLGGGAFGRVGVGPLLMQLEVLAITKGLRQTGQVIVFTETGGQQTVDIDSRVKTTYIEVPITVMYRLARAPYVFGGAALAFEVDCRAVTEFGNGTVARDDCEPDPAFPEWEYNRRKMDVGVVAGLGLEFPIGPGDLLVEGRYTHGLLDIRDDEPDAVYEKNRSFALFAGFGIPIGDVR